MNFRLTAILFGTLFVLGLVLLILSFFSDERPPTDIILEELVATKPDQIDTIEFEREGGTRLKMVRSKDSNQWSITEPYTAKADSAAVQQVVGDLLRAKPTTYPGMTNNPAVYGLQPPGMKVTLRAGDKSSTVNLGNVTLGGKGVVFVTTSARPGRPMAVAHSTVESLFREAGKDGVAADLAKWTGDFRSRQIFPADTAGAGDDVTGVTLSARGKTLSLAQSQRGWKFTSPASWGEADPAGDVTARPGTFTGVRPLLGALTSLQALSAADFLGIAADKEAEMLKEFGLDDGSPDRVRVEMMTKNGQKTTAFIGNKAEAAPPTPGAMPQTGKRWVKVEGQPGVIRANAGDLSGLVSVIENPDPLRDRNLLATERLRIDGLDLANGATKLRRVGTSPAATWKLYGNPAAGDPQIADVAEAERILNVLTERRTVRSFPSANDANFGQGSVAVKVWADGFDPATDAKAEPKEKGKPTVLTFGKQEGDAIHVRRVLPDGTTEHFLVPEKIKVGAAAEPTEVLAAMNKSRLDLLERDLKGFASTNAIAFSAQGASTFQLTRDTTSTQPMWRFAADGRGPTGQVYKKGEVADAPTVQGMLDILATTPTATRIVDEAPTAEKLLQYGLGETPRLRVIVGLKDAAPTDAERSYELGKETSDPNMLYARQGGNPRVFTLPKFILEKFINADLRNRDIFKVNPAEVARVEITGWGNLFGAPAELILEKNKEGVWTATKAPTTGYTVDSTKVTALMNTLNSLRVEAFTADNTPEPKHGLADPKQVFVITLATATGAHHLHLRLGGPADASGTTLYALTSRMPDGKPIVTVDAAPFKAYKEGPAAFAR